MIFLIRIFSKIFLNSFVSFRIRANINTQKVKLKVKSYAVVFSVHGSLPFTCAFKAFFLMHRARIPCTEWNSERGIIAWNEIQSAWNYCAEGNSEHGIIAQNEIQSMESLCGMKFRAWNQCAEWNSERGIITRSKIQSVESLRKIKFRAWNQCAEENSERGIIARNNTNLRITPWVPVPIFNLGAGCISVSKKAQTQKSQTCSWLYFLIQWYF